MNFLIGAVAMLVIAYCCRRFRTRVKNPKIVDSVMSSFKCAPSDWKSTANSGFVNNPSGENWHTFWTRFINVKYGIALERFRKGNLCPSYKTFFRRELLVITEPIVLVVEKRDCPEIFEVLDDWEGSAIIPLDKLHERFLEKLAADRDASNQLLDRIEGVRRKSMA